mgnify:CR=1 FL=1
MVLVPFVEDSLLVKVNVRLALHIELSQHNQFLGT